MNRCFGGIVVKTKPKIVIELDNGIRFEVGLRPAYRWLKFGTKVIVAYNHESNEIGHILPTNEEHGAPETLIPMEECYVTEFFV